MCEGEVKATCTAPNFLACREKIPIDLTIPTQNLTRIDFRQSCGLVNVWLLESADLFPQMAYIKILRGIINIIFAHVLKHAGG
jgi:hypothetical protein